MLDPQQRRDKTVTFGLFHDAMAGAGINQNNGEVSRRSTGCHIASVLHVTGCVGDDEFTFGSREITVGDIDRNALLAFLFQTVGQQRRIKTAAGGAVSRRFFG